MTRPAVIAICAAGVCLATCFGQGPSNVLVVVNGRSLVSRQIGRYYVQRRGIPLAQVCSLSTAPDEEISRDVYDREIEKPVRAFLEKNGLAEKIYYIATTLGVPLKIAGTGQELETTAASVDSELAALYGRTHGIAFPIPGPAVNRFFRQRKTPFGHPEFPIYLVTRLAAYSFADVQSMIDRSLAAKNKGQFVIDARGDGGADGNAWLRDAVEGLPKNRVVLDVSGKVLYEQRDVIAYASWGSNDPDRRKRRLGFEWLPGAIATEFVSTNGRTFLQPPEEWQLGNWKDPKTWFSGSPQTMTADLIHEGASGASGNVYEPFLGLTVRPDYLLPAYFSGRNLAESFYLSLPAISWQGVIAGDPLCRLR